MTRVVRLAASIAQWGSYAELAVVPVVAAHQYLEAGEQFGKVVVTLESES
ncbi:NADPH:quinone reductase-like Zn-dependent oxidoreductase [Pseudomonas sp. ADAK2 TE3594]